jgi:hypothetical protein
VAYIDIIRCASQVKQILHIQLEHAEKEVRLSTSYLFSLASKQFVQGQITCVYCKNKSLESLDLRRISATTTTGLQGSHPGGAGNITFSL